ncbi:MAG: MoxR-like ATPase, MoxR-like protein ATPase [Candidatus Dadabacteria bacterium CSP1-2]|nr:MAG: MoxR-like ATPase, MoxR-like protein ATPase [Candidatus Dadabacteria bacterium CSP1-2]
MEAFLPIKKINSLKKNIQTIIKGKPEAAKATLVAFLSQGHMLIEDVPGVGKTTLAQVLARSTDLSFKRVQFTSDLLPSDILGVSIYDQKTGEFDFKAGPIFANIILADEINRATPKTQSALLEAMSESKITIDGKTYELPKPFMVIATQNPFEYRGTFPLPENQLDRFSMRVSIGYPDYESEKEILLKFSPAKPWDGIQPVVSREEVLVMQTMVERVHLDESILDYILTIIKETRNPKVFELGVSPRGAIALKRAAQSHALIEGRAYCIPDDVKEMAVPVLSHRVILKHDRMGGKGREEEALKDVLERVKVPI